jgi:hypothetical protein
MVFEGGVNVLDYFFLPSSDAGGVPVTYEAGVDLLVHGSILHRMKTHDKSVP